MTLQSSLVIRSMTRRSWASPGFAALLRVLAPFAAPFYAALLVAAGIAWTLAFLLFCRVYLPILLHPRADGQPG